MNENEVKKVVLAVLSSAAKHYKQVKEGRCNIWQLIGKIEGYLNVARVLGPISGLEEDSYMPILKDLDMKLRPLIKSIEDDDDAGLRLVTTKQESVTILTPEGVKKIPV